METAIFARLFPISMAESAVVNFSLISKASFAVLLPPSAARRRRILLDELKAISDAVGINTEGRGIIFSLPVDAAFGLGGITKSEK